MKAEARPLYAQVRATLTHRIAEGAWTAGEALPSEFALAAELGVSQGTVRKALNEMAADHEVERRQGLGTFVPVHTPERALFHFFRITDPTGAPLMPGPISTQVRKVPCPEELSAEFPKSRTVWQIRRLRAFSGAPALVEDIHLDPAVINDPGPAANLPNALYPHYQATAGVSVARAEDFIQATSASQEIASELAVSPGTPLLTIERRAFDLKNRLIEHRRTSLLPTNAGYRVHLR
ncbi:GntR family transcriptional regulator [Algicella marina]|nr:GntR family transcriptional regulator [Algicella marina]